MESIREEGYSLATRKPSVLVPRVVIEGQELTPEFVGTLYVRVLHGNHRISCLMERTTRISQSMYLSTVILKTARPSRSSLQVGDIARLSE